MTTDPNLPELAARLAVYIEETIAGWASREPSEPMPGITDQDAPEVQRWMLDHPVHRLDELLAAFPDMPCRWCAHNERGHSPRHTQGLEPR
jgi:hypothetical protein